MKVDTKALGLIEIDDKQKINFPRGLFGFEDYCKFVLFDAEHEPFYWLQSVDEKEIAFILINPFLFRKDYEANVSDEELTEIGIVSHDNILVFVIVTIPQDGSPMTANLQGPLIINRESMTGMQAVISDAKWKTKHDILSEISGNVKG
ncbi:MAG: flagellar assembly protein FliW [Treponema sp.]|jgi:flagellar assembly factor FliW|nr:flagellar assembly protein FliW [Treponema sp.]